MKRHYTTCIFFVEEFEMTLNKFLLLVKKDPTIPKEIKKKKNQIRNYKIKQMLKDLEKQIRAKKAIQNQQPLQQVNAQEVEQEESAELNSETQQ